MLRATDSLAYLTADVPGTGGLIKERPEDFLVDEQPLYQPCGTGEHLYLFIEKREQTTTDVVRRLAKMFSVRKSDVGYAGLKDKHAITRQHFSIWLPDPSNDEKYLSRIPFTNFKLLWSARHTNKLRRGHLAGNRFIIRIRQVSPTAAIHAKRILDRLVAAGAPNYVGDQRFGYRQNNQTLGRLYLQGKWKEFLDEMLGRPGDHDPPERHEARNAYERGEYGAALDQWARMFRHDRQALDALRQGRSPEQAVMAIDPMQREFMISSTQSAIFNHVLDRRIREGVFDRIMPGDLAWKHDSRAVFAVDDAAAQADNAQGGRVARLEVSPSGPMWGGGMTRPSGVPLERELEAIAALGLTEADLCAGPRAVGGSRRPMRLTFRDPDISGGVDEHGPYIRAAFELPRGSFATMVLREIMKPCIDAPRGDSMFDEPED
jgi:tRNA pseudouridine13 synthase